MLNRDPVVQELSRGLVAERGVAAIPIVERLDVRKKIGDRFVPRRVTRTMHALVLQAVEETFGRCIDAPMSSLDSERHPLNRPGSADTAREQYSASGIVEFPSSTDLRRFGGQRRRGFAARSAFLPLRWSTARCWQLDRHHD